MKTLERREGDVESWSVLKEALADRFSPASLASYCDGCSWLKLNYCSNGLRDLKNEQ